jgi:tRNA threonylcarbamoyladenosine biosynthesis protein TsaE
MERVFSLDEIDAAAAAFLKDAGGRRVIAFHGGLGAGKTTFIKALCAVLGVKDVVSSPTFSLINEYAFTASNGAEERIFHLDLYRIRDEEEAIQAGIADSLESGSLCLVEWPEKIPGLLPEDAFHVILEVVPGGRRLSTTPCL